jgi:hypothetical protein
VSADQVEAWARAKEEARKRLMAKYNHGPGSLAIITAVVDAPHTRALWLEGGAFAHIYRTDPAEIERRLAQHPEITEQDVLDAWALLDDALGEAELFRVGLRIRAGELGMPDEPPLGAVDVLRGLRNLARRRRHVDEDERQFIRAARAAGIGWAEIGEALGYQRGAKQSAYRRARTLGLEDLIKGGGDDGAAE